MVIWRRQWVRKRLEAYRAVAISIRRRPRRDRRGARLSRGKGRGQIAPVASASGVSGEGAGALAPGKRGVGSIASHPQATRVAHGHGAVVGVEAEAARASGYPTPRSNSRSPRLREPQHNLAGRIKGRDHVEGRKRTRKSGLKRGERVLDPLNACYLMDC